jgi:hypothetical protein
MLAWVIFFLAMISQPPHVVLITIDGVRHQEIFNGTDPIFNKGPAISAPDLVPNLYYYFVGHGVAIGKVTPIVASGPNFISLPGYLEITRGHPSRDCQVNECRPIVNHSILQLFSNPAVFGSWIGIKYTLPLHYQGYSDIGQPYYRDDIDTMSVVDSYLTQHKPDFLWVSLGDTDEYAHRSDYHAYLDALHNADAFIGKLIKNADPNTIFVVTADHGRNANFRDHDSNKQSQRVWLMLYGSGIPTRGFVGAEPLSLSNIYPTILSSQLGFQLSDSILSKLH